MHMLLDLFLKRAHPLYQFVSGYSGFVHIKIVCHVFAFSLAIDIIMKLNSVKLGFRTINSGRRTPHLDNCSGASCLYSTNYVSVHCAP